MSGQTSILWRPQAGPQKALIDCPVPEVFYGGARGGGKTDGVLGKYAIKESRLGKDFNAIIFRKELPMLDDLIARSHELFGPIGGKFQDQKKTWLLPHGGRLRFRPLERTQDADKYQGQNLSDACIEEAGQFAAPAPIDRLWGALRGKGQAQMLLTGNPGGAGQLWIKHRYVDPAPGGMRVMERSLPNGAAHKFVFIPSKLQNNAELLRSDPNYINRLYLVGNRELVKAWLDGDWNAIEGAYFDDWSQDMVIEPFPIPDHWARSVSFDWGSAKPFSAGWWAIASEDYLHNGQVIPKGAAVRYREWYGVKKDERGESIPNAGLKLTAEQLGDGIRERTPETVNDWIADPSIFSEDGGPSHFERMKIPFRRADNKRVGKNGHMGGWDMMRERMRGGMIFVFDTCVDSIRTIPVLQHDDTNAEDLDSDGEDHAADDWRYFCMSRPWTRPAKEPEEDPFKQPTLEQLLQRQQRKRKNSSRARI